MQTTPSVPGPASSSFTCRWGLLDRYLIRRYLVPFAYCMAAFLLVMLIYDFSINLEDFIEGKVRLDIVLEYFAYSLPIKITQTIPMASLLSVLYCVGQLKKHNEIIAFQASGITVFRLLLPFLMVGLLLSGAVFGMQEMLLPHCRQRVAKLEALYMNKDDSAGSGAVASVFAYYDLSKRRSWVGVLDPVHERLERVEIREFDEEDRVLRKIEAQEALYRDGDWVLSKGRETRYDSSSLLTHSTETFYEEHFTFAENFQALANSQKEPAYMNLRQLHEHIQVHPAHSRIRHEESVDYHHKTAFPILNLLVMLLGVPVGLRSQKGHFAMGVATCLLLFVAYYVVNLFALTMGKSEAMPAWLGAWFANLLFGGIGLGLLFKSS